MKLRLRAIPKERIAETFQELRAIHLVEWIADRSISGFGPFISAEALAAEYMGDPSYRDDRARVSAMIRWECSKTFSTGFITSIGGLATLPAAIPAGLGASWLVQSRLAAAIASVHGHDVREDRVRTLVALSLLGNAAKDELKHVGVNLGNRLATQALGHVSGKFLMEINRIVGFRLISRSGEEAALRLCRFVPVAGGLIGGAFDSIACRTVGRVADSLFSPRVA